MPTCSYSSGDSGASRVPTTEISTGNTNVCSIPSSGWGTLIRSSRGRNSSGGSPAATVREASRPRRRPPGRAGGRRQPCSRVVGSSRAALPMPSSTATRASVSSTGPPRPRSSSPRPTVSASKHSPSPIMTAATASSVLPPPRARSVCRRFSAPSSGWRATSSRRACPPAEGADHRDGPELGRGRSIPMPPTSSCSPGTPRATPGCRRRSPGPNSPARRRDARPIRGRSSPRRTAAPGGCSPAVVTGPCLGRSNGSARRACATHRRVRSRQRRG